jgi:hypothetical protein
MARAGACRAPGFLSLAAVACGDVEEADVPDARETNSPAETTATPPASPVPAQTALPATPAAEPTPTMAPELERFEDSELGFALEYPSKWRSERRTPTAEIRDYLGHVEFFGKDDFRHASVYVFSNPDRLPLREWIDSHDPIFAEADPRDIVIAGAKGLFVDKDFSGLPTAHAYVEQGGKVYGLFGLTLDEFQTLTDKFTFAE